jgi:DNA-binding beta-propeller fold protein YncE
VAVLAREKKTGEIGQILDNPANCISEDGTGGICTDGVGLGGAVGVAVSPDGRNVYVASFAGNAVAVFARDR